MGYVWHIDQMRNTHMKLLSKGSLTQRGCLSWKLSTNQLISHAVTPASWFSAEGGWVSPETWLSHIARM